jgi:DNA-binding transcriptional ArsR family regulator
MLRIHFTEADLRRVRVVAADPLWETILGVQQLVATRHPAPLLATWRQDAKHQVYEHRLVQPLRLVHMLAPEGVAYFPDFLTPPEGEDGLTAGLTALVATPNCQVATQVATLVRQPGINRSVLGLAARGPAALSDIATALRMIHTYLIRPAWTGSAATVQAECARRAYALRKGGIHGLLHSLRPTMQWDPPILSVAYPEDRSVHLGGRGLRLAPSHFCWRHPVALADPALPQTLVYPVDHGQPDAAMDTASRHRALATLLGDTRARILAATARAATTIEVAQQLRISAATVSTHASALRQAGLITSTRDANRVIHQLTALGTSLLHGRLPDEPHLPHAH